ncbi:hypothetical protein BASA60_008964 [Batrachochytrium salamandrivorans]|nr:hypothetical protein BASA60_008964 [Batrachochytrium salamandrivorans]
MPSDAPPLTPSSQNQPAPAAKISDSQCSYKDHLANNGNLLSPSKLLVETTNRSCDRILTTPRAMSLSPAKRRVNHLLYRINPVYRVQHLKSPLCSDVSVPEDHESPFQHSSTITICSIISPTVDSALIRVPEPGSMLTNAIHTNGITTYHIGSPCPSSFHNSHR